MKESNNSSRKHFDSKGIMVFIFIFVFILIGSSCHRKTGVKPGGMPKIDKSKCNCKKKKGGIYADFHYSKSMYFCLNTIADKEKAV